MGYPHNIEKRAKYLESLTKLTESQEGELQLLNIILENNKSIAINKKKDPHYYDEVVRYLTYSNEIVIHMLNNRYYENPELF